jgi:hypothetical protein
VGCGKRHCAGRQSGLNAWTQSELAWTCLAHDGHARFVCMSHCMSHCMRASHVHDCTNWRPGNCNVRAALHVHVYWPRERGYELVCKHPPTRDGTRGCSLPQSDWHRDHVKTTHMRSAAIISAVHASCLSNEVCGHLQVTIVRFQLDCRTLSSTRLAQSLRIAWTFGTWWLCRAFSHKPRCLRVCLLLAIHADPCRGCIGEHRCLCCECHHHFRFVESKLYALGHWPPQWYALGQWPPQLYGMLINSQ